VLAACKAAILSSFDAAVAALEQKFGAGPTTWQADETVDEIRFTSVGVSGIDPMPWQNRPTFQQVLQFSGVAGRCGKAKRPSLNELLGSVGRDRLRGTPGADAICASRGKDRLIGRKGNDILLGGPGNDLIRAGGGDDILRGQGGKDVLLGGKGDDVLSGGGGKDRCSAGAGKNRLRSCDRRSP
jgi:hypothetical protein